MEEKRKEQETPVTMPMLALRGLVLFPNMVLHFEVGREKSMSALNQAMKNDQKIFLVAQKDVKVEDPGEKDLFRVGVVAKIRQILKAQGSTLRVLVEGDYRAKMLRLNDAGNYLEATVESYPLKTPRYPRTALCDALMRTV